jgi:hypothetical protein
VQHYIVSFLAGSSGRFISSIVWNMINEIDQVIEFTDVNSAHNESPWEPSWHHPSAESSRDNEIYNGLEFIGDCGLLATHTFLDYEVMRRNLLNVKAILITIDRRDIEEISHNTVVKNGNSPKNIPRRAKEFNHAFYIEKSPTRLIYKFYEPNIPEDLTDRILTIQYSEIYKEVDGSFVALEKLKSFTGKECPPNAFSSYQQYVTNRNKLWNK